MHNINESLFKQALHDPDDFTLTFELVPGRGGRGREFNRILGLAEDIAADGRFKAVSITENAGGYPALSPEVLGLEIRAMGPEVIIHFSCKDKNRNQMESLLFAWERGGLRNLLVIAGDYPKEGYRGFPKPVFDFDTVHVLDMLSAMNKGVALSAGNRRPAGEIQATSFMKGVAFSPFKLIEAELMMQYYKLHRKVAAGADYVITQLGFDARKFQEVILYIKQYGLDIPILGNVFIPNLPVTELMYRGKVPGCVIPDSLYEKIKQEANAPDRGKRARLSRAAKLLAILKGLGYNGAHIGGPGLSFADLAFVLEEAEGRAADWRTLVGELSYWPAGSFYYYEKDESSGLNLSEPAVRPGRGKGGKAAYFLARQVHDLFFDEQAVFRRPLQKICLALDQSCLRKFLFGFEHIVKFLAFRCQNCGDCTLADLAYICPQADCAKYLLNGPCGGSRDGWCEVYPGEKRCLYVLVYERLKACGREAEMKSGFVPPRDWALNNTSSWVNFFRGLDHTAAGDHLRNKG